MTTSSSGGSSQSNRLQGARSAARVPRRPGIHHSSIDDLRKSFRIRSRLPTPGPPGTGLRHRLDKVIDQLAIRRTPTVPCGLHTARCRHRPGQPRQKRVSAEAVNAAVAQTHDQPGHQRQRRGCRSRPSGGVGISATSQSGLRNRQRADDAGSGTLVENMPTDLAAVVCTAALMDCVR